jgi:hypothetical protein
MAHKKGPGAAMRDRGHVDFFALKTGDEKLH